MWVYVCLGAGTSSLVGHGESGSNCESTYVLLFEVKNHIFKNGAVIDLC